MKNIIPVILAGGSGTRLWPMSSREKPKQFHRIASDRTLFQDTILRVQGEIRDCKFKKPIVISNLQFSEIVREQLREIDVDPEEIILEPVGRNTAPAVAVAALLAAEKYPDSLLLFLPADHAVIDVESFKATIAEGADLASAGQLVTFGIVPSAPETGYGYILRGLPTGAGYSVARFVEKPNLEVAKEYLKHGGYYWNAGIFLFSAADALAEMKVQCPELVRMSQEALMASTVDGSFTILNEQKFKAVEAISIDYALMEKTARAAVVPMKADWNDIGSWSALSELRKPDMANLFLHDSAGSFAISSGPNIAIIGVPNVVVIATDEGIVVVDKNQAQEVKRAYNHFEKL